MGLCCVTLSHGIALGGHRVEGDVLVGTDGIWSKIRKQLLGEIPASYSAYTCYTVRHVGGVCTVQHGGDASLLAMCFQINHICTLAGMGMCRTFCWARGFDEMSSDGRPCMVQHSQRYYTQSSVAAVCSPFRDPLRPQLVLTLTPANMLTCSHAGHRASLTTCRPTLTWWRIACSWAMASTLCPLTWARARCSGEWRLLEHASVCVDVVCDRCLNVVSMPSYSHSHSVCGCRPSQPPSCCTGSLFKYSSVPHAHSCSPAAHCHPRLPLATNSMPILFLSSSTTTLFEIFFKTRHAPPPRYAFHKEPAGGSDEAGQRKARLLQLFGHWNYVSVMLGLLLLDVADIGRRACWCVTGALGARVCVWVWVVGRGVWGCKGSGL